jgi:hypothetical protein
MRSSLQILIEAGTPNTNFSMMNSTQHQGVNALKSKDAMHLKYANK